jgi:hypothetical protein
MITTRRLTFASLSVLALAACGPSKEHTIADSAAAVASAQQAQLSTQLTAQKDSLTRIVLQADDFIMQVDKSMSKVKGLPKGKKKNENLDPLARQLENRKLVMERVNALVARAQATAAQLARANSNNAVLRQQIAADSALIVELNATIQRQTATIEGLSVRVDSLKNATQQLTVQLAAVETETSKAFYVVGKEDDLVKRGVIVREGGANLLIAHPGRTLQIARTLPLDEFTTVDSRGVKEIQVPDSTRRYRLVSRQSLDAAEVADRKRNTFRGNLHIADASKFWGPSKYLVLVEQ